LSSLWHYNLDEGKVSRLTDEMTSEDDPAFSPDGDYLFFTSERDFNLTFSSYEFDYLYHNATRIYGVAVNDEIAAVNAFSSDEVKIEDESDKDTKEEDDEEDKKGKEESTEIKNLVQVQDFMQRVEVLNAPAGNYGGLLGVENGGPVL
jgi:tricorn protease